MMLLDGMGLWVRDCPTLFVSAMSFRIFGRSSPKEVLGAHLFLMKCVGSFDSVQVLFSPFGSLVSYLSPNLRVHFVSLYSIYIFLRQYFL